jgi:hypothetical protein
MAGGKSGGLMETPQSCYTISAWSGMVSFFADSQSYRFHPRLAKTLRSYHGSVIRLCFHLYASLAPEGSSYCNGVPLVRLCCNRSGENLILIAPFRPPTDANKPNVNLASPR